MICSKCGSRIEEGEVFCPECGTKVESQETRFCDNCGNHVSKYARFCDYCGAEISADPFDVDNNSSSTNKTANDADNINNTSYNAYNTSDHSSQSKAAAKQKNLLFVLIGAAVLILICLMFLIIRGTTDIDSKKTIANQNNSSVVDNSTAANSVAQPTAAPRSDLNSVTQVPNVEKKPTPVPVDNSVKSYMYIYNCNKSITLREAPNTSSNEITQMPYGASIGVIDTNAGNGFYKVNYNGIIGYAASSYITQSKPPEKNVVKVSEEQLENFIDSSLRAFVNGINTGDTSYISEYFTGSAASEERNSRDEIDNIVVSEQILSLNCHSASYISENRASVIRDSVIRVVYNDGSVKDITERYKYYVQVNDDGTMRITGLEEK